jgi:hypothetical protein
LRFTLQTASKVFKLYSFLVPTVLFTGGGRIRIWSTGRALSQMEFGMHSKSNRSIEDPFLSNNQLGPFDIVKDGDGAGFGLLIGPERIEINRLLY